MSKVFKHSFISEGKFLTAGIPVDDSDIRPFMLKYEAKEEKPSSSRREINLRRQLNQRYYVDEEGNMTVPARRATAEQEAINAEQDYIDGLSNEPNDPATEAMFEEMREDHAADMARRKMAMQVAAENADQMVDDTIRRQDEAVASGEYNEMDIPSKPPPPKVNAPKPKWQYVKRGSVFRRVKDPTVKLKMGEDVYVRNGNGFEKVGIVSKRRIENE